MITTLYRLYAGSFVMGARTPHSYGKSTFVCEPPTCAVFLASGHGIIDASETRGMETSEYLGISCIHTTIVPVLPRDLLRAGARW